MCVTEYRFMCVTEYGIMCVTEYGFMCVIQTCENLRLNQTLIEFNLDFIRIHVAIFLYKYGRISCAK